MPITIHKESIVTNASKKSIWDLWTNVEKWPQWDKEIEWANLNGNFQQNQTGTLKPKGAPSSTFKITTCIPLNAFTDTAKLPFATLIFDHQMTEKDNQRLITHHISITGPLAKVFNWLLGKKLKDGLIKALPQLIKLAEENEL
jgi:hypothetical protein